jgi:hypothetical protein
MFCRRLFTQTIQLPLHVTNTGVEKTTLTPKNEKIKFFIKIIVLSSVIFLGACANDEPLKVILDVSTPSKTALDSWIDTTIIYSI